jgi:predicted TIM-barrel fold metal-dependent hydrolase
MSTATVATTPIRVVDNDSHLTEPPDLWTSRLPRKWLDDAPRVEIEEDTGIARWRVGDRWLGPVGGNAIAGRGRAAGAWEDIDPACYDLTARLAWMDANGIYAQVLYPNLVALEGHAFMALSSPEMKLACIRANNDHFAEFCAGAPDRFVPLASLPFWDLDATIAEMERCAAAGHKGVVWAATLLKHGLPGTADPYWDRFYATAQDLDMSINFHVGVGYTEAEIATASQRGATVRADPLERAADQARRTALGFMSNGRTIADIVMSGLCDRFPRLKFVSVESGFGFIPYLLEALDWQWTNPGHAKRWPERLLPSEYFRRQVYCMFWFERTTLPLLAVFPDNVLFETDFPHDTSITPGPGSDSPAPYELVEQHIARYGRPLMRKVLWENAAKLYRLS